MALLVSGVSDDPAVSCLSLYVQADGSLDPTPMFQTPDEWGTIQVLGEEIVPSEIADGVVVPTRYNVQADEGSPGNPELSLPVVVTTWVWGDVDDSRSVEARDIELILLGVRGVFDDATRESLDLAPCRPDGLVNVSDLQQGLKALGGESFGAGMCSMPCR